MTTEQQQSLPLNIPRNQPLTAWQSVPTFLRFTAWVAGILFFIYTIVVPVVFIVLGTAMYQYAAAFGA